MKAWSHHLCKFLFQITYTRYFFRHLNLKCLKLAVSANFVPHKPISLVHVVRSDVKK